MQFFSSFSHDRPAARFLSPSLLISLLAVGSAEAASGPLSSDPEEALAPLSTTYEPRTMPEAPWMSNSTAPTPDWIDQTTVQATFAQPGLGSASFGDNPLPSMTGTRPIRPRGGSGSTPIPLGPIDVSFDAAYSLTYGTGLLSSAGGTDEASYRHAVTPAMNLYAGDRWSIRYAPSLTFFTADGYDNTVDHAVVLAGSATAPGWLFGLNHGSSITSTPLIETGRQTDQTLHSTGLSANWDVNGQDSLTFALSQNIRFADAAPDSYSWSSQNWYDRAFSERLSAGLGFGIGYDYLDPGVDMVYERFNARLQGSLGSKVTYRISGGAEIRQFSASDSPSNISPLVSAVVTYQVLDKTSLFLGFDHLVSTSYFSNQFTENSSVQAGLTQILSSKWSASANGGFRSTSYLNTLDASLSERSDDSVFVGCSLSWRATAKLRTTAFYSFRSNSSDQSNFEFDSNQFGLRLSYAF
jgi:hypothetical protein